MDNNDKIIELLIEVRDEFRAFRTTHEAHTKPKHKWYEREPIKTVISHSATVCVALILGYMVHECTGGPVNIVTAETQQPQPQSPVAVTATTNIDEPSVISFSPAASSSVAMVTELSPIVAPAKILRPPKPAPTVTAVSATATATALAIQIYPDIVGSALTYPAPPAAPASVTPPITAPASATK
jgi:hypothetical protein